MPSSLSYAPAQPAGSQGHLLDLYLPTRAEPAPVVLWSRGSAWMQDNGREGAAELAEQLNPLGFAVAGVSIRSSSQATFPAQLHDIKSAIRWLRAHAEEFHLDAGRFGIAGDSSGGWTAAMAGLTGNLPWWEGDVGITGPSSAVQAVVSFYPPTDFLQMDAHMPDDCTQFNRMVGTTGCHRDPGSPESRLLGAAITACPDRVAQANPVNYVTGQAPPFLIFHGQRDPLVPYHQGQLLYEALAAVSADVRFVSYPEAGHGVWRQMMQDPSTQRGVFDQSPGSPARPATISWATVTDFFRQRLSAG